MKVLLIHNFYSSKTPSGENQVVIIERDLLKSQGNVVSEYFRDSDEILRMSGWGTVKGALATPWNFFSAKKISQLVNEFSPDVVHVHNTFPLISPSIFSAIGNRAAKVLTLHNYRLVCPAAIPMRNGKVCTECIKQSSVFPALLHGCYRNSRIATVPLAINVGLHRYLATWKNHVDAFIALSLFQKDLMAKAGLPAEKIHIKPNFYPGSPNVVPWSNRSNSVVFVGRISAEKGVVTLLKSWKIWGVEAPHLYIVGDGPLRRELEEKATGLNVTFTGQIDQKLAQSYIAAAKMLILPSEWFEGFPLVIREAFAFGTPVAASDIGPLPSLVKHNYSGVIFPPSNSEALVGIMRSAWADNTAMRMWGINARSEFDEKYTEGENYKILCDIYRSAQDINWSAGQS